MSKYEVGQILYLTNEKSFKIIPVQVVEEVVRTTIEGTFKTYLIQFPDKNNTVADISDIKYKCFKTENEVRDYLIENTKTAIENLLSQANSLKNECFAGSISRYKKADNLLVPEPKTEDKSAQQDVQPEKDSDIIKVDLGNGQVGKIKKNNLNVHTGVK